VNFSLQIAFEPSQPLDELPLALVLRADPAQAASKFALASFFRSQRLKIGKQFCRPVIAGRIAAFAFAFEAYVSAFRMLLR
jgi:hypothetical protein